MADSPLFRFYRQLKVPMPYKTWRRLPRLASHKNEYWDGFARYTPRPKSCDIYLELAKWAPPAHDDEFLSSRKRVAIRRLNDEDWAELPDVFHSAFCQQQPLWSWEDVAGARAARCTIQWTRSGGDGPVLRAACFSAWDVPFEESSRDDLLVGAALVTLVPHNRLRSAPADVAVPHPEDRHTPVVAHLTWIFVGLLFQRQNVGTLLLQSVVEALRGEGFRWLSSTCTLDNAPSLLWHWRNGFQLPPNPVKYHAVKAE